MIILLVALFSVVALLFCLYVVTIKTIEVMGVLTLLVLGISVVAVGCVSFIVGCISVAALYQLWGGANIGWVIAVSGLIVLASAWALLRAVVFEIKNVATLIKGWFGYEKPSYD